MKAPFLELFRRSLVPIALFLLASCAGSPSTSEPSIAQRDCEADGNFVFVPAGEFVAGSDRAERDYGYRISAEAIADSEAAIARAEASLRAKQWFEREASKATKNLSAFCIARNLVTNAEYQAFVSATDHRSPGISEAEYQQQGFLVHPYEDVKPFLWRNGKHPAGKGQHPVVLVSYEDALAFAAWQGERDGYAYRLPAADEWEKAARGTDGRYFPWGDRWEKSATNAEERVGYTNEIGAYPRSRSTYGIEDMAGNVFEYTSTLGQETRGRVSVMKGCSWDDLPGFCRAAYRHTRPVRSRHILFGFRLVRERS